MGQAINTIDEKAKLITAASLDLKHLPGLLNLLERRRDFAQHTLQADLTPDQEAMAFKMFSRINEDIKAWLAL